jgi:hypothetical protein
MLKIIPAMEAYRRNDDAGRSGRDHERRKRLQADLPDSAPTSERLGALQRARWAVIYMVELCHALADPELDPELVERAITVARDASKIVEDGKSASTRATLDLIWAIRRAAQVMLRGGPEAEFLAWVEGSLFADVWPEQGQSLNVQAFKTAAKAWAAVERPRGHGAGSGRIPSKWPEVCAAIASAGLPEIQPETARKMYERDPRSSQPIE